MSANQYTPVDYRINSCMIGSESYRVVDEDNVFDNNLIEEITNAVRQEPGNAYVAVQNGSHGQLWMVPFQATESQLDRLLDAMELVHTNYLGEEKIYFPLDVVSSGDSLAYLMKPLDRESTKPIRTFMPCEEGPRWQIAISLFRRVQRLQELGLTSNGISREQLRCSALTGDVSIWLNHTLSLLEGSESADVSNRHKGFLSIPDHACNICAQRNLPISGSQRDVYSAAVTAFYLILHIHPFIGCDFFSRVRQDYLTYYQNQPKYILEPDTTNHPGNLILSSMTQLQWEQTVPALKSLFDQIFLAVTHPEKTWDNNMACWDPKQWIEALTLDMETNKNASSIIAHAFTNEWYRLV